MFNGRISGLKEFRARGVDPTCSDAPRGRGGRPCTWGICLAGSTPRARGRRGLIARRGAQARGATRRRAWHTRTSDSQKRPSRPASIERPSPTRQHRATVGIERPSPTRRHRATVADPPASSDRWHRATVGIERPPTLNNPPASSDRRRPCGVAFLRDWDVFFRCNLPWRVTIWSRH